VLTAVALRVMTGTGISAAKKIFYLDIPLLMGIPDYGLAMSFFKGLTAFLQVCTLPDVT
jgi:hypothetical protein